MRSAIVLLTLVAFVLIAGCSDNKCTEPYCCSEKATLDNIWPNEDQTSWTFAYKFRSWDYDGWTLYQDEDSVPPAPSMDEALILLFGHGIGENPIRLFGTYGLQFDGDTTTLSGVTAQNLRETLIPAGNGILTGLSTQVHEEARQVDPLLLRLAVARPDLRDRIANLIGPGGEAAVMQAEYMLKARTGGDNSTVGGFTDPFAEPLFIHGYAWRKTSEWIGTYGDVDTLLAWKFLEADLVPGHEFTHQLVPSLADDVVLHCRVLPMTKLKTPAGVFVNALECLYMIDFGVTRVLSPQSDESGWARLFEYGVAIYVPTVGPVYSYHRMMVDAANPDGPGYGDIKVSLTNATTLRE
jgi:hypothetical protein